MQFKYDHALIPSGTYIQQIPEPIVQLVAPIPFIEPSSPLSTMKIELCNPMAVRPVESVVIEEVRPPFAAEFERVLRRVPVITPAELNSYAEQLLEIGRTLARRKYDVVIIPLRGGLKPWLQLDVLREFRQQPLWLPYTAGSQGKYDDQVMHILNEGLREHVELGELQMAIIDTAISGDGSRHLADLLSISHRGDVMRRWQCDFHLLHAKERFPEEIKRIPQYEHENLTFAVTRWPVDQLVVEDWNEAIGLEVHWEGRGRAVIKHCSTEGRLLLRRADGGVQLIESSELHHYIDVLLGDALSQHVVCDPSLQYQRDVWKRYVER